MQEQGAWTPDNLDRTLRAYGAGAQVARVDASGDKFAPALHEAVSAIP